MNDELKMTLLNQIHNFLEEHEYQSVFVEASEKLPIDSILVVLGLDHQQREQKLEIVEFAQNLNMAKPSEGIEIPEISRVQFKVLLPYKAEDLAMNDVAAFLHFINQSIDLPGFEFNELEGLVMYRYVWITSSLTLDPSILKTILSVIGLNVGLFSEVIESLALQKTTFNDILSDIVNKFKEI